MILITGISGFVGSNLRSYLYKNKKKILGASRNPALGEVNYSEINETLLNNTNYLIHLAGKAHDLKTTSEDLVYYKVNTELTKRLFDEFIESTCPVFIYMSSVKAAADSFEGILTEGFTPKPITAYGKSKFAAEEYILSKKRQKDKRVYILRPCMIHGPNNKGNLNLLYSFVSKGIPYPFGKYINSRSFVSVENLCFIINELMDNDKIASGIYNVADDESISTVDLVKLMSEVLGIPNRTLKLPKLFISCLAKIGDFLPIPINSERLAKLTENYEVSNLKIKNAINKKWPLTSSEGIKKTITSF